MNYLLCVILFVLQPLHLNAEVSITVNSKSHNKALMYSLLGCLTITTLLSYYFFLKSKDFEEIKKNYEKSLKEKDSLMRENSEKEMIFSKKLKKKQLTIENLNQQINKSNSDIKNLETCLLNYKEELKQLNFTLNQEKNDLSQQLEKKQLTIEHLNQQINKSNSDIKNLETCLLNYKEELKQLNFTLNQEKNDLSQKLEEKQLDIEQLNQQIRTLQTQLSNKIKEFLAQSEIINNDKQQIDEIQTRLTLIKQKEDVLKNRENIIDEKESQVKDLNKTINILKNDINKYQNIFDDLSNSIVILTNEEKRLKEKNCNLLIECDKKQRGYENLKKVNLLCKYVKIFNTDLLSGLHVQCKLLRYKTNKATKDIIVLNSKLLASLEQTGDFLLKIEGIKKFLDNLETIREDNYIQLFEDKINSVDKIQEKINSLYNSCDKFTLCGKKTIENTDFNCYTDNDNIEYIKRPDYERMILEKESLNKIFKLFFPNKEKEVVEYFIPTNKINLIQVKYIQ